MPNDKRSSLQPPPVEPFTQVYRLGWETIYELSQKAPQAIGLYSFLAQHMDSTHGCLTIDKQHLADRFNVSVRTIYNWTKALEDVGAIIKVTDGGSTLYCLDVEQVWRGKTSQRGYAVFNSKTIIREEAVKAARIKMKQIQAKRK